MIMETIVDTEVAMMYVGSYEGRYEGYKLMVVTTRRRIWRLGTDTDIRLIYMRLGYRLAAEKSYRL